MSADNLTCVFCDASFNGDLGVADRVGWTWWTGWLIDRQAACASCQRTRAGEIAKLQRHSQSTEAREEFENLRRAGLVRWDRDAKRWERVPSTAGPT